MEGLLDQPLEAALARLLRRLAALLQWSLLVLVSAGCTRCDAPSQARPHSIPELRWSDPPLPDYVIDVPQDPQGAWRIGIETLKTPLAVPSALETRLRDEPLELWRASLEAFERYRVLAESTVRSATLPRATSEHCEAPGASTAEPFDVRWDLRAQQLLQQRRNILWRLGRLELAARSFHQALTRMTQAFGSDRSRHAEEALLDKIDLLRSHLERYDSPETRPDGEWLGAALRPRFARHRPVLLLMVHAEEALRSWREETAADTRWGYTAPSADAPLTAIEAWRKEHDALVESVASFSAVARGFSSSVDAIPRDASPWWRCMARDVQTLARLGSTLENALQMQQELATGGRALRSLRRALADAATPDDELLEQTAALERSVEAASAGLMALESAVLGRWDAVAERLWSQTFPHLVDTEARPTTAVVGDRAEWRKRFFASRDATRPGSRGATPEPEQGLDRRGRARPPFVTEVLDLARSPARVAEVEQGLLAISELDAHLAGIQESITRACRAGDCAGLPTALVAGSPRDSQWVAGWRERPVGTRTLGHNVLVLELSRLHLTRQAERLATFHGWFAELSSADLSWFRLPAWEQTWQLYTGTRGSFLSFLRSLVSLDQTVRDLARPHEGRPVTQRTQALLDYQATLFALTLDYARFVDRGGEPPVPFETVIAAWEALDKELRAIEQATLERDEKQAARREAAP